MNISLYNTLHRRQETFIPIAPHNIRLYVCGPTVYDYAHIGNARPVVVFDTLFRLLRRTYGVDHVTYVRNITDIEDKIIDAAARNGETILTLTERTAQNYQDDMAALKALPPTHQPRATEYIDEMIHMISCLVSQGHAYQAGDEILFHVPSMPNYGELSKQSRDEVVAGARVEVAANKKDPADFILWKPSRADQPGWDSPWGRGRPGWHIECSAMSEALLGETFDIHGGGQDLIFPHHENEIAQSRCAHKGAPLANYWMHNGFVVINGEKMSKSLGNFFTVRELLERGHPGEVIRLALLSSHYRQPLDITEAGLLQAKTQLDRFYIALRAAGIAGMARSCPGETGQDVDPFGLYEALAEDLNTPLAISRLHDAIHDLNKIEDAQTRLNRAHLVREAADLLGLLADDPTIWLQRASDEEWVEDLIAKRQAAKEVKNFAEADRIRAQLLDIGILLEDRPGKTEWRRK